MLSVQFNIKISRKKLSDQNIFITHSHEQDAPWSAAEAALTPPTSATAYILGLEPEPRDVGYGQNSWLSMLIVGVLVLLALNVKYWQRMFKSLPQDLVGVRRRNNAFDDHTAGETPSAILLIMILCLSEGILMLTAADSSGLLDEDLPVFPITMIMSGLALAFNLLQVVIYRCVGYAFTTDFYTSQWIRGFHASQCLLAALLLLPAMVALFYPASTTAMLAVASIVYIFSRLLFVYKGFRIFFNNYSSVLYFILYLCSVEIIPLVILKTGAEQILRIL